MMMSLAPTMKSTGVLLLVFVAISCTAVDAFGPRSRIPGTCIITTDNAVCRVTELPGTVNPVSGIIRISRTRRGRFCGVGFRPLNFNLSISVELQGFSTSDSVTMHELQALELGDLTNGCASLGNTTLDFGNLQEAADGSVSTTFNVQNSFFRLIGRGLVERRLVGFGRNWALVTLVMYKGLKGGEYTIEINVNAVENTSYERIYIRNGVGNSGPPAGCCVIGVAATTQRTEV